MQMVPTGCNHLDIKPVHASRQQALAAAQGSVPAVTCRPNALQKPLQRPLPAFQAATQQPVVVRALSPSRWHQAAAVACPCQQQHGHQPWCDGGFDSCCSGTPAGRMSSSIRSVSKATSSSSSSSTSDSSDSIGRSSSSSSSSDKTTLEGSDRQGRAVRSPKPRSASGVKRSGYTKKATGSSSSGSSSTAGSTRSSRSPSRLSKDVVKTASATNTSQAQPASHTAAAQPALVVSSQVQSTATTASHTGDCADRSLSTTAPQLQHDLQDQPSSSSTAVSAPAAGQLSAGLPAGHVAQLKSYLDHLLEVNKVMNLTAIRDPVEAWERHIEDSLALLPVIEQHATTSSSSSSSSEDPLSIIDVGTGAGLPGMVFAIVRPEWQVTLLDSLRKRCDFLQGTASMLGLTNVRVVWSRAEEGARQPDLREGFDVAVARAVAELRVLAELCLPFVKPGGVWVAAKGFEPQGEAKAAGSALSKLNGRLSGIESVQSWSPEGQRTAVVVHKLGSTPQRYPRTPGTPSKNPL